MLGQAGWIRVSVDLATKKDSTKKELEPGRAMILLGIFTGAVAEVMICY